MAFTRAILGLYLPPDFKGILTSDWQAVIKRYEPVQSPKTSHAPFQQYKIPLPLVGRGKVRGDISKSSPDFSTTRSGPSTTPQPKAPRKKPFKVGDRVRTSHGIGTVVEVDGDKYLVDLEGQAAQLWEKAWGIKKV